MEFTLLLFLKLRTAAPKTDTDSFTCHLRWNSWNWRSTKFTLVKYSFLLHAQAFAIKEIWFFDMKENKSENYSTETKLYEEKW